MLCSQSQDLSIEGNIASITRWALNLNMFEGSRRMLALVLKTQGVIPINEQRAFGGVSVKEPYCISSNGGQLPSGIFTQERRSLAKHVLKTANC